MLHNGKMCMILHTLITMHDQCVLGGPVAKSHSSIAECDKNSQHNIPRQLCTAATT